MNNNNRMKIIYMNNNIKYICNVIMYCEIIICEYKNNNRY